jgi:hypothetical protein
MMTAAAAFLRALASFGIKNRRPSGAIVLEHVGRAANLGSSSCRRACVLVSMRVDWPRRGHLALAIPARLTIISRRRSSLIQAVNWAAMSAASTVLRVIGPRWSADRDSGIVLRVLIHP